MEARSPKGYGAQSQQYGKGAADIAMPPLDEVSPIERLTNPNAVAQHSSAERQAAFNNVPDELPEDVQQEMNNHSLQESDPDEVEQEKEYEEEEPVVQTKQIAKQKTKSDNFAELRNARERAEADKARAEAERNALMSQLLELQAKFQTRDKVKEQEPEDYEINIADDDLVAGKDMRKVDSRTKALEKRLAQYEAQAKESAAESRVRSKCPDLDQVVTDENIYMLRQNYPEVAQSLASSPDNWDKLASVYTMIKTLGIHKTKSYESDKMKALNNVKKPRPVNSVSPQQGESPLSNVNAFVTDYKMTKDAKAASWKEMQDAMKKA